MVAKKVILDDVEKTLDAIEPVIEAAEKQINVAKLNKPLIATAAVIGVVAGAVVTYAFLQKKLKARYQQLADEQIEDVKNHYAVVRKDVDLEEMASQYEDDDTEDNPTNSDDRELRAAENIIKDSGYISYNDVEPVVEAPTTAKVLVDDIKARAEAVKETVVEHNIFAGQETVGELDMDVEMALREKFPDRAFVLNKDEFMEGEEEYEQSTLTYYEGDDVLLDSKDGVIDDVELVVGVRNLLRFGQGSGDHNVVYVRSPRLTMDFEVIRDDAKYAEKVLGFSLEHSDKRKPRRFRHDDE